MATSSPAPAQDADGPVPLGEGTTAGSKPRGLARVPAIRSLVHRLIHRSDLEIRSVEVHGITSAGFKGTVKVRFKGLGTGPLPLLNVRVSSKGEEGAIYWPSEEAGAKHKTVKAAAAANSPELQIARVRLHPFKLQSSSTPGCAGATIKIDVLPLSTSKEAEGRIAGLVHRLLSEPEGTRVRVVLQAGSLDIKAYGIRFAGIEVCKEFYMEALGGLGGAIRFGNDPSKMSSAPKASTAAQSTPFVPASAAKLSVSSPNDRAASVASSSGKKRFSLLRSVRSRSSTASTSAPASEASSAKTLASNPPPAPPGQPLLDIAEFDLVGGSAEGVEISAKVVVFNPTKSPAVSVALPRLSLALGVPAADAKPGMPLEPVRLGTLNLEPSKLVPGANTLQARGVLHLIPEPTSNAPSSVLAQFERGRALVAGILQNEAVQIVAFASPETPASTVPWLAAAFVGARIEARLQPLGVRSRLLDGAEIRVEGPSSLPGTPRQSSSNPRPRRLLSKTSSVGHVPSSPAQSSQPTDMWRTSSNNSVTAAPLRAPQRQTHDLGNSVTRATLRNGFGTEIRIHSIDVLAISSDLAEASDGSGELQLGRIQTSDDWPGLLLPKGGVATHASLPMAITDDTQTLIDIFRRGAARRGVALGSSLAQLLDEMEADASWRSGKDGVPEHAAAAPFDDQDPASNLASLLARALHDLHITAHITAAVSIGGYRVPGTFSFTQKDLPIAVSDQTASALLPTVAKPFVDSLIERCELQLGDFRIEAWSETAVHASITIGIQNFGTLPADISFDDVMTLAIVDSNGETGKVIARMLVENRVALRPGTANRSKMNVKLMPLPGAGSSESFGQLISSALMREMVEVEMHAVNTSIRAGGVDFSSELRKRTKLRGMNSLHGLRVEDFTVTGEAPMPAVGGSLSGAAPAQGGKPSALAIRARVIIPNSSDLKVNLARLELSVLLQGVVIGQVGLENIDIDGKEVVVETKGLIYIDPGEGRAEGLRVVSSLINDLVAGREVQVEARGQRAWVNALAPTAVWGPSNGPKTITRLPWLDTALKELVVQAPVRIPKLPVVDRIEVGSLVATFPFNKPPSFAVDGVVAQYSLPYPINVDVKSVGLDVELCYKNKVVGHASVKHSPVQSHQPAPLPTSPRATPSSPVPPAVKRSGSTMSTASARRENAKGEIRLKLDDFDLIADNDGLLGDVIAHCFEASRTGTDGITLRGTAHIVATTALGDISISLTLGQDHVISVGGLDGLRSSPVQLTRLSIVDANPGFAKVVFALHLNSPSPNIRVVVPDSELTVGCYYQGLFMGRAIIGRDGKGFSINPGPNSYEAEFRYQPSSDPTLRDIPANILSGKTSTLEVRGDEMSTSIPALRRALSEIRVSTDVKPLMRSLLASISVTLSPRMLTHNDIEATFTVKNPLEVPIMLESLAFTADYRGQPFGVAQTLYPADSPFVMTTGHPNKPTKSSGQITVKLSTRLDKLVKTFLKEAGQIPLDVKIHARVLLGGSFRVNFAYEQKELPLQIEGLEGVAKILSFL